MKRKHIIFLRSASIFSGALSILMELHFFYGECRILMALCQDEEPVYPYESLMIIDAVLGIVGLCLCLSIDIFLRKRGENTNGQ